MAQFRADISGMKTTAAKIVTLSDELYQMKKEMRSIDVKNVISDHSFDELQEALNQIIDHLDEQALEASSMGDALKQTVDFPCDVRCNQSDKRDYAAGTDRAACRKGT